MKTIRITSLLIAAALTSCAGPMQNGSYPSYSYANTGNRYSDGPSSYYSTPADQPQISRTDIATTQSSYTNTDGSTADEEATAVVLGVGAALLFGALFGGGGFSSGSSDDDTQMQETFARQKANRAAYYSGQQEPFPGEGR
ncbi:MAG: hypothetical protein JNN17_05715 [Verrucomicrobiaceae bacterium]|nr:hypothetical protein [Verrucomicrobiaceae bacterium]